MCHSVRDNGIVSFIERINFTRNKDPFSFNFIYSIFRYRYDIHSISISIASTNKKSRNNELDKSFVGQKFAMMELRTAIGNIIRNFELRPITKIQDVIIISDLILRSKDPIRVQFLPRRC